MQTVQVHAGNHGFLTVVGCFFVDDAGHGTYLVGSESCSFGLLLSLGVPEGVVLLDHALHEVVKRHVPIHLVGVGYKQRRNGASIIAPALAIGLVDEGGCNLHRVHHQFLRQGGGQLFHRPRFWDGQHHSLLLSVLDLTYHLQCCLTRIDGEASCAGFLGVVGVAYQGSETCQSVLCGDGAQLGEYRVNGVVIVNIDETCLGLIREVGQKTIVAQCYDSQQTCSRGYQ